MLYRLSIYHRNQLTSSIRIGRKNALTIGSSDSCDVVLPHTNIPPQLGLLAYINKRVQFRLLAGAPDRTTWQCLPQSGDQLAIDGYELAIELNNNKVAKQIICTRLIPVLSFFALVSYGCFAYWPEDSSSMPNPIVGAALGNNSGDMVQTTTNNLDNKLAGDLQELLRLSGYQTHVELISPVDIEVRGYFQQMESVARVIHTESVRTLVGKRKIHVRNLMVGSTEPNTKKRGYEEIVAGNDPYLVDGNGSRYYLGSTLPDGRRLIQVDHSIVVLVENGEKQHYSHQELLNNPQRNQHKHHFSLQSKGFTGYDAMILKASRMYGVSPGLVKAMIHVESAFNPTAESHAGALGLMQIMPETARSLGLRNPFNAEQNVIKGTQYIKQLLTRYQSNLDLALAAYNAGMGAVSKYQGIPPYRETQNYVAKVKRLARVYTVEFNDLSS